MIILISVLVAWGGVMSARALGRQRATLDMIEKVESTLHYRDRQKVFSANRLQGSFAHLHNPATEALKLERHHVLDYLNHYELVSLGILQNILDADIYRNWMRGPFVRDWNAASQFIQRERWKWDSAKGEWQYYHALFTHFQSVAEWWSDEAVKLNEGYSPAPVVEPAPIDEAYPPTADGNSPPNEPQA
nr:DUF4760 domain-containing protein [Mesorhizobium sp. LNHC220B00]